MQVPYRKPGKYQSAPSDPLMTAGKFAELERKLERLKQRRPEAAAEVARLAELGDFSENVEYQLAKGRLRGINNSILKIGAELSAAQIIKPARGGGFIEVGHTVEVRMDGADKTFTILGSAETDPARGIISHNSPIGAALLGHAVGDEFDIVIAGKTIHCKVSNYFTTSTVSGDTSANFTRNAIFPIT